MNDKQLRKWGKDLIDSINEIFKEKEGRQRIINEFLWSALSEEGKDLLCQKIKDYDKRDKKAIEKEELERVKKMFKKEDKK